MGVAAPTRRAGRPNDHEKQRPALVFKAGRSLKAAVRMAGAAVQQGQFFGTNTVTEVTLPVAMLPAASLHSTVMV